MLDIITKNEIDFVGKEQIKIRLPIELKEKIQRKADEIGIGFNAVILILIQKALEFQ